MRAPSDNRVCLPEIEPGTRLLGINHEPQSTPVQSSRLIINNSISRVALRILVRCFPEAFDATFIHLHSWKRRRQDKMEEKHKYCYYITTTISIPPACGICLNSQMQKRHCIEQVNALKMCMYVCVVKLPL